ncbi:MAG: tRNA (cytidine(34)-2'-O)-methyltransferase [Desulfatiglandales bacterium]
MSLDIKEKGHKTVENPALHVVLYQPEIPANTGNIARLCGAAEVPLHLIHPLGFRVDDRHLRRAGLDYWHEVDIRHHRNFQAFEEEEGIASKGMISLSRHATETYTRAKVGFGDYLLFGRETSGLPVDILQAHPGYRIPIWGGVRSLNLSTSVGIVVYHFLHEMGRF